MFKVGDKVYCIKPDVGDPHRFLVTNAVFTILGISYDNEMVYLKNKTYPYEADRFVKVTDYHFNKTMKEILV